MLINVNNEVTLVRNEIGGAARGKIEIKSGLAAGDKLITVGYQDLNDGEKVKL